MEENQITHSTNTRIEPEMSSRRDLVQRAGKFAIYAAPFTVLAVTSKASSISGSGGGPVPGSARPRG